MSHPTYNNNLGFVDPYGSTSKAVDALFTKGKGGSLVREASNGMLVVRVTAESPFLPEALEILGRGE